MSRPPPKRPREKLPLIFTEPSRFPDARLADPDGVVAEGGDLEVDTLLDAYRHGIFPWPCPREEQASSRGAPEMDLAELLWFSPEERFLLEFDRLRIPRSLDALRKKVGNRYRFTIDQAFPLVLRACSKIRRKGQRGTWITDEMVKAYGKFYEAGHAHSVEAWEGDELIGGIYGVDAGGAFAGESMFSLRDGVSKLALLFLVEHLRARGLGWLDAQTPSKHLELMGARPMAREEFLKRLHQELEANRKLFPETGY